MTYIYALCDATGRIRYIGKTNKPKVRLGAHISEAKSGKHSYKCHWIRQMLSAGTQPTLKILIECDGNGYDEERYLIWLAKRASIGLTNNTDGGEGWLGKRHTPESRRKLSEKHRGKVLSPETKAKIGAFFKGRKQRPDSIAKRTNAWIKTRWGIDRVYKPEDMRIPSRKRRDHGKGKGAGHKWAKTTSDVAQAIYRCYHDDRARIVDLAAKFGLRKSQIWNIVSASSWKHLGLEKPVRRAHFNAHWRPGNYGYRGIGYDDRSNRWMAYIVHSGKRHHIGCYATKEEAARAYDAAARKQFGEEAVVNFP